MSGVGPRSNEDYEMEIAALKSKLLALDKKISIVTQPLMTEYNELSNKLQSMERMYLSFRFERLDLDHRQECREFLQGLQIEKINGGKCIRIGTRIVGWKVRLGDMSAWFLRLPTGEIEGPWPIFLGTVSVLRSKWREHLETDEPVESVHDPRTSVGHLTDTTVAMIGHAQVDGGLREFGTIFKIEMTNAVPFFVACGRHMVVPRRFDTADEAAAYLEMLWKLDTGSGPFLPSGRSGFYQPGADPDDGLDEKVRPE